VLTNYPNALTSGGDCMLYLGWLHNHRAKGYDLAVHLPYLKQRSRVSVCRFYYGGEGLAN